MGHKRTLRRPIEFVRFVPIADNQSTPLNPVASFLRTQLSAVRKPTALDFGGRADLTVASLLSGYARPREMPIYHNMAAPDALAADVERWRERPVMRWVTVQYRAHRTPTRSLAAVL